MPKQFVTNSTTTLKNYRKRIFDPEPEYGQNVLKVKIWPDISVLKTIFQDLELKMQPKVSIFSLTKTIPKYFLNNSRTTLENSQT